MIYIYVLFCPETGEPRYVGKCKNLKFRLSAHLSKAKGHHTDHHCANWIRALLRNGLKPVIQAVEELDDNADWQAAEIAAIAKFREAGHDLTNGTAGGEGFLYLDPAMLKRRGQTRSRNLSDPEVKAKFLATVGASHSRPDVRENHSHGAKSAWADPIKREKMLASMRTPEALARRAEATRRRYADPEALAKHSENMKRALSEPETRKRMKLGAERRWNRS